MSSNLPDSFLRGFRESNPGYRPGSNQETDALFNPSIAAKPLHVPVAGQIRKRLNTEMEFFWAFDRCGQSPFHERVEQLRSVGFDYATTKDVDMAVADTVKGENEIRSGDRRLMKVQKSRWLEIRKSQQLSAIMMASPKGKAAGEGRSVMTAQTALPGIQTEVLDPGEVTVEQLRAKSVVSDAAQDLREGRPSGNTSVVNSKR
jgi:hypothetical protein